VDRPRRDPRADPKPPPSRNAGLGERRPPRNAARPGSPAELVRPERLTARDLRRSV